MRHPDGAPGHARTRMGANLNHAQQDSVAKLLRDLGGPDGLRSMTSRDEPHDKHVFVEVYRNTPDGWALVCEVIIEGDGTYEPPMPPRR